MSRNGSGTYNLPAGNPVVTGTTITSSWANGTLTDIATALTGSLAADGQTPATGNLNMNTNQIKNVVDPTLAQDAATKAYVDAAIPSTSGFLVKTDNLSDVANATTARGNLTAAKSGANSDITSITGLTTALTVAQGGTGLATTPANGALDIGNGTNFTRTTLTAGTGIAITNGAGSISIAATGSGTVTSVATGNGLSGGTITTTGTLVLACPSFNSVGSYIYAAANSSVSATGYTMTAGSNYSAGTTGGQIISTMGYFNGASSSYQDLGAFTAVSGTWKWMSASRTNDSFDNIVCWGMACRVS